MASRNSAISPGSTPSAAADQLVAQSNPGLTYDQLEQGSRAFIDNQLRSAGLKPPSMSEDTRLYLLWRSSQPQGADTSIAAFLRYMESLYDQNAEALGSGK